MSIIDKALEANQTYAKKYDRKLGAHPTPKIAVVTCMDPRLSNLPEILGLPHADIDETGLIREVQQVSQHTAA
jgi:carbonic anhydrase